MCKKAIKEVRERYSEHKDMPAAAQLLLDQLKISTAPIQIVKLVKEAGFEVYRQDFNAAELSGLIAIDEDLKDTFGSAMIICVNSLDNLGHQRFAIAHEFAHYIFDFDTTKSITYYDSYSTSEDAVSTLTEKRASFFAANLLMPRDLFVDKFEKYAVVGNLYETTSVLAELFQVSAAAVKKRIEELELDIKHPCYSAKEA